MSTSLGATSGLLRTTQPMLMFAEPPRCKELALSPRQRRKATVCDFKQFKNGAQFGAWIGLTPRQHSSGGKARLGGIAKRGDTYLCMLLIQGAKSAVLTAHRRSDPISQWLLALRERSGWQKAAVALANKNARILWAMFTRGVEFDARHVSVKPGAAT